MTEVRSTAHAGKFLRHLSYLRFLAVTAVGLLVSACGGGNDVPTPSSPAAATKMRALSAAVLSADMTSAVKVQGLVKKSETRVSRTVFEYEYALVLANSGPELQSVEVRLTGAGASTTVVEGISLVDRLPAKGTLTTADTIRVRHDRLLTFRPEQLVWQVTGSTLGPVALPGHPADAAIGVMTELDAAIAFPAAEFDLDLVSGTTVLRTKIAFGFKEGTTIGQVNAYLASLGATIVRTYDRTAVVEVKIADPGSVTALNQVLTNARTQAFVSFVVPMVYPRPDALPAVFGQSNGPSMSYIAHHLAVRGSQAWNARRAADFSGGTQAKPVLLIADYFGGGDPDPIEGLLNVELLRDSGTGFTKNTFLSGKEHGYHVLGIAAAKFNGVSNGSANLITGMYVADSAIALKVMDLESFSIARCSLTGSICQGASIEDRVRSLLLGYQNTSARLILNTSIGGVNLPFLSEWIADSRMNYWLHLLRGEFGKSPSEIESRVFHAASAGNDASMVAGLNAGWTSAAMKGLVKNTAVIENRTASNQSPFKLGCLASDSSRYGNISAVGSLTFEGEEVGVSSYKNAAGDTTELAGTSMAAPQVAGLAAYIWSIRNDLTSSQILEMMMRNAMPIPSNCSDGGQPAIDAYATLLAVDDDVALTGSMGNPSRAPVRVSILDIDEDGSFTHQDAIAYIDAFAANINGGSAFVSSTRTVQGKTFDLTRFDLNGDGFVGGTGKTKFNLDISYDDPSRRGATFGTVPFKLVPQRMIDENAVTDLDVLCYYIYSPLFKGERGAVENRMAANNLSCMLPGPAPARLITNPTDSALNGSTNVDFEIGVTAASAITTGGVTFRGPLSVAPYSYAGWPNPGSALQTRDQAVNGVSYTAKYAGTFTATFEGSCASAFAMEWLSNDVSDFQVRMFDENGNQIGALNFPRSPFPFVAYYGVELPKVKRVTFTTSGPEWLLVDNFKYLPGSCQ